MIFNFDTEPQNTSANLPIGIVALSARNLISTIGDGDSDEISRAVLAYKNAHVEEGLTREQTDALTLRDVQDDSYHI